MSSKYITRILTTRLSKADKEEMSNEIAQLEANLGDAESRFEEHKKAARESSKDLKVEIKEKRAKLAEASAGVRAGVVTREVKCYKKMVGKKEVLFRADTDKPVPDADIVANQQLTIDEAGDVPEAD